MLILAQLVSSQQLASQAGDITVIYIVHDQIVPFGEY